MGVRQIQVRGEVFETPDEALQHSDASGVGEAVTVGGKYLVLERDQLQRIESLGVELAYLTVHKDRIMTVPVN